MVDLQLTLKIAASQRAAAAGVYRQYKAPFLETIAGAKSNEMLAAGRCARSARLRSRVKRARRGISHD
ncbi:hypothetical protein [Paraburkholderia sp. CNPSo 3281]|uniref:hypothetical protein n=1 Tax=Paraburkholderia sp. CNPSo 3281 TaxID=2940933 RepID=UPI0020B86E9E|nr:hypothetical protein [Paraburkholderia sp. CNPSo 3281]MCP3716815.1 hypothetical protein [Paraburkholderia sp. CNPSo 3281]